MSSYSFSLVGHGRAGGAVRIGLIESGWVCRRIFGRDDDVSRAGDGVDVCIVATPDDTIERVASLIEPGAACLVHLSGSRGLDVLAPHRAGAVHPLTSLAEAESGAERLRSAYFAIAGDPIATEIADALSGQWFVVDDEDRATYHAAGSIASNHLVAVLGQVERLAEAIGVPFEVFLPLVEASVANVAELGPGRALTGPAARGDLNTIEMHRRAIEKGHPEELAGYDALVERAFRLAKISEAEQHSAEE